MSDETLLRQAIAMHQAAVTLQAQAEAVIAGIEERIAAQAPAPKAPVVANDPTVCEHPESVRDVIQTGGGTKPGWFCKGCKHTSEEIDALAKKGAAA